VVAHAGDLPPRDGRVGSEQGVGESLDCLADLQQPDPDSVEDQAVGQVATLQRERIASIAAWMSDSRWRSR
jgi:predicted transcriptional regulator